MQPSKLSLRTAHVALAVAAALLVGACGGSCQPTLRKMLDQYAATGTFPENPKPKGFRRKSAK